MLFIVIIMYHLFETFLHLLSHFQFKDFDNQINYIFSNKLSIRLRCVNL